MFCSLKQFLQFFGNFCNCSIRIDHNNAESFENTKTIPNVPENFGTIQNVLHHSELIQIVLHHSVLRTIENVSKSQNDWNILTAPISTDDLWPWAR